MSRSAASWSQSLSDRREESSRSRVVGDFYVSTYGRTGCTHSRTGCTYGHSSSCAAAQCTSARPTGEVDFFFRRTVDRQPAYRHLLYRKTENNYSSVKLISARIKDVLLYQTPLLTAERT